MTAASYGIPEISLRNLKSALFVARHKNVTRAAGKLNRSQTAITKAISELESTIGIRLFDRSTTGMMPTVYGEALTKRIARVEGEFEYAGLAYHEYKPKARNYQSIAIFSMDISYKRLAAFIALYETRDINSASGSLGVTKAAIYNSVRQIEELLELELFQREPGGVSPSPYCNVLARHVKLAFAEIRHALEDIRNLDGVTEGRVLIGTLPYTRTFLTPQAINRLLEQYPQLDVATQEGPYNAMEASLRSGDIDCIVGAIRPTNEGAETKTEVLLVDKLSVIARSDHPLMSRESIEFNELQNLLWVLPGKQTPARQLFDKTLAEHNMHTPSHAVETSSGSMIRGLLLDSDRVALLSAHQIHYDKLSGLLDILPVKLEHTARPIGITLRAHTEPSPAAALFIEILRGVAVELSGTDTQR